MNMKECPGIDEHCCEPIMDYEDYCHKCREKNLDKEFWKELEEERNREFEEDYILEDEGE